MRPVERGFTMVELIVVIVIAGILAIVVGPRFFDRQVFDERLFFEESLSAARYAQKLAVASGCPIHLGQRYGAHRLCCGLWRHRCGQSGGQPWRGHLLGGQSAGCGGQ
jgi:MSHA pilin protein MshC